MIQEKCKAPRRAVMDHIGPMTHDRLSAEQSWGIYDP